jgi:hypothetical protein
MLDAYVYGIKPIPLTPANRTLVGLKPLSIAQSPL